MKAQRVEPVELDYDAAKTLLESAMRDAVIASGATPGDINWLTTLYSIASVAMRRAAPESPARQAFTLVSGRGRNQPGPTSDG